ncbi:unnamed protein product [Aspergillus oryzae var. brunneus]|uniref:Unnamed protein product n=1 Tax=Aspergillus oryzae var. brunneus TaxID=332754 RepID=A0ABQ6LH78_ASPOZ|nr:unnamed protein product [Aspergillus oryzae var. brunneus]
MKLAGDNRLKDHVHHLLIRGVLNSRMGLGFQWTRHNSGQLDVEQSPGARWLRDILLSFPNCRSFTVHLDYGWNDSSEHSRLGPSDGITIIMDIVAETGIPVRSFSVYAHPSSSGFAFNNVDPRCLQFDILKDPAFINSWAQVEKLKFHHNFVPGDIGEWVASVITLAPRLKTLEIGFDYTPDAQVITTRLSSGPVVLSELRELVLTEASEIEWDELLTLLRFTCRTLRCLTLQRLQLKGGTWIPLLAQLYQFPLLEDLTLFWLNLVNDSKLSVRFYEDFFYNEVFDFNSKKPGGPLHRRKKEQKWIRERRLGRGTFADVWLYKCDEDVGTKFQAVKVIPRLSHSTKAIDYTRELEAMFKFSHRKVRYFLLSTHSPYAGEDTKKQ